MKSFKHFFLVLVSLGVGSSMAFGQWGSKDANKSKPARFGDFHSNLGQQGIIELTNSERRAPPASPAPAARFVPSGNLQSNPVVLPGGLADGNPSNSSTGKRWAKNKPVEEQEPSPVSVSVFAGSRPYQTNNVLRSKSGEMDSGVWENTLGGSITGQPFKVGNYVSLIPRLDLIMQWSNYGEETVSDLLDYRFGMIKGGLGVSLPGDWTLTAALEYDVLHSQSSGDRMFDAVAPSLQLQKVVGLRETTFLMVDGMLKLSNTNREIDVLLPGIFADDGDNFQTTLNLSLIQAFGENGKYVLMPTLGLTRSEYLKNTQDGRADLVFSAGVSGIWQAMDWLSLQTFLNYSTLSTNSEGDSVGASTFDAWDVGLSATVSHTF
ncbi:MAG: hypothetical protein HN531_10360 [Opitutae bacterium]|nr:hypothetical protein [Opitutae bacterium]